MVQQRRNHISAANGHIIYIQHNHHDEPSSQITASSLSYNGWRYCLSPHAVYNGYCVDCHAEAPDVLKGMFELMRHAEVV
jgi:hypothetical protein